MRTVSRRGLGRALPILFLAAALALSVISVRAVRGFLAARDDTGRHYLADTGWPQHGEAAWEFALGPVHLSPGQTPVPIASVAKVMTAYDVLTQFPLSPGADGFSMTVDQADVDDYTHRLHQDQSVVRVRVGERLTERQALAALLLPSANNIAAMLAARVAGSQAAFVELMNQTSATLGMTSTIYTDPSGFASTTRSTAGDQLRLGIAAMRIPTFAELVGQSSYRIPVAGVVHNTDSLLGRDGFAGIKTGSMNASGGCFVFETRRVIDEHVVDLYGVVLGQHGHNLVTAALTAARQLTDRIAPVAAVVTTLRGTHDGTSRP